jgi:hypothetical protein
VEIQEFRWEEGAAAKLFVNYMKLLSYVFRRKGILYQFDEDFNSRGEFHGVAIDHWHKIRKDDPTFGTGVNVAKFIQDYDKHMHRVISEGKLNYLKDPVHLRNLVAWIMGRYLGFRGKDEHAGMMIDHCYIGQYGEDDGDVMEGTNYFGYHIPNNKKNQLNFGHPRAPTKRLLMFAEDSSDLVLNAFQVVIYYLEHCHPEAKKFYATAATKKQRAKYKKKYPDRDIWYCPSGTNGFAGNYGRNNFPDIFKWCA